jgi:HSP20 family protein
MKLMRWEPMEADGLWMDRIFDNLLPLRWGTQGGAAEGAWWPRTDIVEEKDAYRIDLDLPGLRKDNIKLTVQDDHLEISGERNFVRREDQQGYERLERSYGSFRRSFRLPEGIEAGGIESTYENGVLTVRIPKPKEAVPRQIEIKVR